MIFLRYLQAGLLSLLPLLGGADAYALPGACSGVCVNTHDPSIIRRPSDGTYFRFSTGGKIAVHTAPALTGPWTYKGAALPSGSSINLAGNQDLWAPDVIQVGSTFYLYYSVSTFGSQNSAIGVATSSSLDVGTWSDRGTTGVSTSVNSGRNYNAIDPSLAQGPNGQWLMTFGSWWGGIHQVPMGSPPTSSTSSNPSQLVFEPVTTAVEGPTLFRYGSYYYLFYSQGLCCGYDATRPPAGQEYKIMVCRSSSATGGFVDRNGKSCASGGGTVVLPSHDWVYGPGGQGVFTDPSRGPVLYYHYVDTRVGYGDGQKRFGWNTVDFSSGWPVV